MLASKMGAESSTLKDLNLGQPYFSNSESAVKVTICPATNQADSKKYTVFQYPKDNGTIDEGVEKHLEVLRTTRHPHILRHVAIFNKSRQSTLVTEHVVPLDVAIERQEKDEIFVGLFNILDAIIFLHDRSNICHNGISVSSVFVADNGDWKLAAFEASTKIQRLAKQSYHADVIGFGEFALSVLEYLKDDGSKTSAFMKRLQEEFADDQQEVCGSLKSLREDKFFKFPYMDVVNGLKKLPLKSHKEKDHFFSTLEQNIHSSSPQVVCRQCGPMLFSNMVLLESSAQETFLKCLFSSGSEACLKQDGLPLFDEEYFVKYSLPCIYELFKSRDASVRLVLMKHLPLYVDCIEKKILQDDILPQLLSGLQDNNDGIIAATFQALSHVVSILGGEAVVGSLGRKIFFDQTPDFSRTGDITEHVRPARNVADIMSPKLSLKSSPPKILHSDSVTDDKRLKRMEREKQREEQRKKREERRKQRDEQKFVRVQKQSSDDASTEWNENTASSHDQDNEERQQQEMGRGCDEEHSEPDWEGFEAFSSNGSDDSESKTNRGQEVNTARLLPSNGINTDNGAYHTKIYDKTSAHDQNRISANEDDAWENWDETENTVDHVIETSESLHRMLPLEEQSIKQQHQQQPSKSKVLSLAGIKKITTKSNKDSGTASTAAAATEKNNKNKMINKNTSLGEEYDIKIKVSATSNYSEPDYFADMLPSVDDIAKSTIKIERKNEVSTKFQALAETGPEETIGWGDDDDGGWGDNDF